MFSELWDKKENMADRILFIPEVKKITVKKNRDLI